MLRLKYFWTCKIAVNLRAFWVIQSSQRFGTISENFIVRQGESFSLNIFFFFFQAGETMWRHPFFLTFFLPSWFYTVLSWVVRAQILNSISAYLLYSSLGIFCLNWVSEMHDISNFRGKKITSKYSLLSLLRHSSCWH